MLRTARICAVVALLAIATCVPALVACGKKEATKALGPNECRTLLEVSRRQLADFAAGSERACASDGDCTTATSNACFYDCGEVAVSKKSQAAYEARLAQAKATACKRYEEADCMRIAPPAIPSCAHRVPTCVSGSCTAKLPWE